MRADPDECWFGDNQCPFTRLVEQFELASRYRFAMMALERWETKNAAGVKLDKWAIAPERFQLALLLFQVPTRPGDPPSEKTDLHDAMHGFEVASAVATACEEAQHQATRGVLLARREEGRRGGG